MEEIWRLLDQARNEDKEHWLALPLMKTRELSRPVLPIRNGRGRGREIDERVRDVWLVELARDWGRRGTSRVGA